MQTAAELAVGGTVLRVGDSETGSRSVADSDGAESRRLSD